MSLALLAREQALTSVCKELEGGGACGGVRGDSSIAPAPRASASATSATTPAFNFDRAGLLRTSGGGGGGGGGARALLGAAPNATVD